MRILFLGDVFGRPGRRILANFLPEFKKKYNIDFVIANGENVAGGQGITLNTYQKLISYGVDCITCGTHLWDKPEDAMQVTKSEKAWRFLRPANYPFIPGKGSEYFEPPGIGVINLLGRLYMPHPLIDCPFRTALKEIEKLREKTKVIIIDFHAESVMEKKALACYLDGKVTAVIGTHTHVQSADEEILPHGTAYLTDAGMVGSFNSIIGVKHEKSLAVFLTGIPHRFDTAYGEHKVNGVLIDADEKTGKALSIKRVWCDAG